MSHYVEMKMDVASKNEQELVEALREHFGSAGVELHERAVDLMTYGGSISGKRAHIVVRQKTLDKKCGRRTMSNDLGYERDKDGYKVHVDASGFDSQSQQAVMQDYSARVATRQLKKQGYKVKREVLQDGTIKVVGVQ